jgi:hypothetical protein
VLVPQPCTLQYLSSRKAKTAECHGSRRADSSDAAGFVGTMTRLLSHADATIRNECARIATIVNSAGSSAIRTPMDKARLEPWKSRSMLGSNSNSCARSSSQHMQNPIPCPWTYLHNAKLYACFPERQRTRQSGCSIYL